MMSDSNANMYMPVAPAYSNGGNGMFDGNNGWWILLLLWACGGWNGNGFGGNGGNGQDMNYFYNTGTQNEVNRGFDNLGVANQLSGIQSAITQGFANAEVAACNRAANDMQTNYQGQIAALQASYQGQIANLQSMNTLQSQFADCCCENRLATCQTQNLVNTTSAATQNNCNNNARDIITNATANTQAILDKLCQIELDQVKAQVSDRDREISTLQNQLNMANLAASQTAQTAAIKAGQTAEIDAMYNRLRDCPVPTMPVYGSQPIFTCGGNNYGMGCGCGGSF